MLAAGAFETPRLLLRNGLGNSSDLVGRYLTYHFQTFTVGGFPFRLHGERGRCVTHLMDDPIVPGPAEDAAARAAGLPWIRGGIVEHGSSTLPIQEARNHPPGPPAQPRPMRRLGAAGRLWVFTMQGEDLPQAAQPHRPGPDGGATPGGSPPAGSPTPRTATSWWPPPTGRRSSRR